MYCLRKEVSEPGFERRMPHISGLTLSIAMKLDLVLRRIPVSALFAVGEAQSGSSG